MSSTRRMVPEFYRAPPPSRDRSRSSRLDQHPRHRTDRSFGGEWDPTRTRLSVEAPDGIGERIGIIEAFDDLKRSLPRSRPIERSSPKPAARSALLPPSASMSSIRPGVAAASYAAAWASSQPPPIRPHLRCGSTLEQGSLFLDDDLLEGSGHHTDDTIPHCGVWVRF